jgi:hypothetical protein
MYEKRRIPCKPAGIYKNIFATALANAFLRSAFFSEFRYINLSQKRMATAQIRKSKMPEDATQVLFYAAI